MLTFVLIERALFYAYVALCLGKATSGVGDGVRANFVGRILQELARLRNDGRIADAGRDDIADALLLQADGKLSARLWVLDTIITAAPLLGLLGTIFGIMQTFNALSAGGISDPVAVSRGIGTALEATALGIATALYGLVAHNALQRQMQHFSDQVKILILRCLAEI